MEIESVKEQENRPPAAPSLSEYVNYREYLRDFFAFKKKYFSSVLRPYSYAVFSAAADIKSPSYLKLVIEGQRNLSDEMASKFARALGLNKALTDEFRLMVRYGQTSDPTERSQYLKELNSLRVKVKLRSGEIDSKTWEAIPSWLSWVLVQMVHQEGVTFEPEQLHHLLNGKTSVESVRKTLDQLVETNILERNPLTGHIEKARTMLDSPENVVPEIVRKLQGDLILLGLESLFNDAPNERESGGLTVCLTNEEFERLKFELRHLRKRLHREFAAKRETSKGERIYQLNIQCFPITRSAVKKSPER